MARRRSPGMVVYLRPEISKNKDRRLLPLSGELLEIMDPAHANRPSIAHLSSIVTGSRSASFRKAWSNACKRAGLSPLLVYDLRRTAVRNWYAPELSIAWR
jgi:integrase